MSTENLSGEYDENFEIHDEYSILSFRPNDDTGEFEDNASEENFIKYENTYRLESKTPFNEQEAMVVVKNEIEKHLNEETKYDAYEAQKLCTTMSNNIKNSIRDLEFERYKIVCIVQIVEKKNQGVWSILRFLRDLEKDKYVESSFENNNLIASIVVGAMYYE